MTQNKNKEYLTNQELSIQLSLNGLSFCVLNTESNTISCLKHFPSEKKQTPFELLDSVKHIFNTEEALQNNFKKVNVIHVNELATLVPKPLFNEDTLADYLKLNSKILKSDFITFDELIINDTINVYVPYVNINNFIYDKYGEFTYKHFSTILIEELLNIEKHSNETKLYVNVSKTHFEIIVIKEGKLLLYNTFEYTTTEDFIYYILFTAEQLQLNPETFSLVLLGDISKENKLYSIAYKYIRNISFGNRFDNYNYSEAQKSSYSDFTLIKSF